MAEPPFRFIGKNDPDVAEKNWRALARLSLHEFDDPAQYCTEDEGLTAAVNTALTLGMPLLLTGVPGVGKTQLAYRIAHELQCQTIFFPVKSTTEAQELFYEVDQLRRLHAAQASSGASPDIRKFVRFQGLGLAILRTMPLEELERRNLVQHAWPLAEKEQAGYQQRQPSVVLIDEIDKAPTDFPNDLLEEIRRCWFRLSEMDDGANEFSLFADPTAPTEEEGRYRPVVVITSNSEKALPDAFLRRCVYYHLEPPNDTMIHAIVTARLGTTYHLPETIKKNAIAFYQHITQSDGVHLSKKPSTAELLGWLLAMHGEGLTDEDIAGEPSERWRHLAKVCLLKQTDDQQQLNSLIAHWHATSQSKHD